MSFVTIRFLKYILLLLIICLFNNCNKTEKKELLFTKIKTPKEQNTFKIITDYQHPNGFKLIAYLNNKEYCIIDTSEPLFVNIVKEMDFDNDGKKDVLLNINDSWGGNCCGSEYIFVSNTGNGKFKISSKTINSTQEPRFEKWNDFQSVLITHTNEGVNNQDYKESTYRYIIKQGELMCVEEFKSLEIPSIEETRVSSFNFNKPSENKNILFDLDNDKIVDTIHTSLFTRRGRLNWQIKFGNKSKYISEFPVKRIGILNTKTNNVNDLVLDLNQILMWDKDKKQYF